MADQIHTTLQRAKTENLTVRIVTGEATFDRVRVIDVDRSDVTILVGGRERRNVHVPHIRSAEVV